MNSYIGGEIDQTHSLKHYRNRNRSRNRNRNRNRAHRHINGKPILIEESNRAHRHINGKLILIEDSKMLHENKLLHNIRFDIQDVRLNGIRNQHRAHLHQEENKVLHNIQFDLIIILRVHRKRRILFSVLPKTIFLLIRLPNTIFLLIPLKLKIFLYKMKLLWALLIVIF